MVARDCNPSTQKVEVGEAEVEGWDIQLELSFKERREKKKKPCTDLGEYWALFFPQGLGCRQVSLAPSVSIHSHCGYTQ